MAVRNAAESLQLVEFSTKLRFVFRLRAVERLDGKATYIYVDLEASVLASISGIPGVSLLIKHTSLRASWKEWLVG